MDIKERRGMMFAELAMARHFTESGVAVEAINRVDSLLREVPVRECDVGTPEEQLKRFGKFCSAQQCAQCDYKDIPTTLGCALHWMARIRREGGGE